MSKTVLWSQYLSEYFSENFVFAARYLAMRQTTKAEKLWWTLWILASLVACIFSMFKMYEKWDENPVTIVYGSELMPVSTIPFPAITICPQSKSRTGTLNVTWALQMMEENQSKLDDDIERKLRALAHVCPFQKYWKKLFKEKSENVVETIRSVTHLLDHVMINCSWRSKLIPCRSMVIERLVDDGICFTFNSLALDEIYRTDRISPDFLSFPKVAPSSDWTRENGYRLEAGLSAYPYRAISNGILSGAVFSLAVDQNDQDAMCMGTKSGFKFAIHAPDEIPLTDERLFRFNSMSAVLVSVTAEVFQASELLRTVDPLKRNCFFSSERPLFFFRHYNQFNCAVECIANYTLAKCGCVKFSMPRLNDTKICDASKIDCYRYSFIELYELAVRAGITGKNIKTCLCLPSCTSVDYQVGLSQVPINDFPFKLDFMRENVDRGMMFIMLKDRHYFPLWRREFVGPYQAIAQLGGLFTLLMGSSMLSFAEVVYYCCVRRLRRERPRHTMQPRVNRVRSRGHRIRLRVDPWAKRYHLRWGRQGT